MFVISKLSIISKTTKLKYNRYMIKTELDIISWIKTDNKMNGRNMTKETIKSYIVGF